MAHIVLQDAITQAIDDHNLSLFDFNTSVRDGEKLAKMLGYSGAINNSAILDMIQDLEIMDEIFELVAKTNRAKLLSELNANIKYDPDYDSTIHD